MKLGGGSSLENLGCAIPGVRVLGQGSWGRRSPVKFRSEARVEDLEDKVPQKLKQDNKLQNKL